MHQAGFCFCILSLRLVASDKIGEDNDRVRMISTELLRTNGEGAPIQGFSLGILVRWPGWSQEDGSRN